MLSERDLELLTGFVDGELAPHQREAALRLLNGSSAARSVLQDLQETAHRLHELPRRTLESAFAGQVLRAIADRGLVPAPQRQDPTRRPWQGWVVYLAAACLVFAVGVGVYLATRQSPRPDNLVVENPNPPDQNKVVPQTAPERLTFKELVQQPKRALLARQLAKETAVHLDLTVHDYVNAVRHLEGVLEDRGIKTIVDPEVKASLDKKGQKRIEYLVYAENVNVAELETILRQLAEVPKQAEGWPEDQLPGKGSQKSDFESMVVTSLSMADREKLSSMGIDPAPRRKGGDKKMREPSKEITKRSRTFGRKDDERYAMVMANGAGASSAALKTFLDNRQQQRPDTVQVLLIIRQA